MMPRKRRAERRVLMLLCAMSFIMYVDRVNLSTAAAAMSRDLHLTHTDLGFIFAAFGYSYAIFQIIGGWLSDRFGARVMLTICATIWAVSSAATGLVHSFGALVAIRLLLGIGEGATLPSQARALTNWFNKDRRGTVQGITHSFSRLGNAVTPPIVAALILYYSWRASFVVLGAATFIWVILWAWYFRNDPRKHKDMTEEGAAFLPPAETIITGKGQNPVPWRTLLPRMLPTMIVYFCYGWTGWLFFTWLPSFFRMGQHLDIASSAFFSSGVFFAGVVGDTLGGYVSDKILKRTGSVVAARRNVIILSFTGAGIFLVPVMLSHSIPVMAASLSLSFFFLELTIAPIWAVPMDIAPRYVGVGSGLMNAGSAVAGIISPIIFGFVIDRTGNWILPFYGSIGILVLGIVASFYIRPDKALQEKPAADRHPLEPGHVSP